MEALLNDLSFIQHGGFMMIPLLISALIALTVVVERALAFHGSYRTPRTVIAEVFEAVRSKHLDAARKQCAAHPTPLCKVLETGLAHFESPAPEMEIAMKNQAEAWMPLLEKRIEVLDTVITAAPLMGLLGTITGMMSSFKVLSEKGVNEPNAITGGVAEALIATATGLVIALLCLLAYNYFLSRVKTTVYEIEAVASKLLELRVDQLKPDAKGLRG